MNNKKQTLAASVDKFIYRKMQYKAHKMHADEEIVKINDSYEQCTF